MESAAMSDQPEALTPTHDVIDQKLSFGEISLEEMNDIIRKMERIQFFESLTQEVTRKIKDIAQELIDFRKDLQKKIEPGIIEMAARDIPEASHQLEEINETLENSTMKIMDINREDPTRSYSDLRKEVEDYRSELKGPLRNGEGLDQKDIDALLSAL